MAPEPLSSPKTAAFPVCKLAPLLRAIADPEDKGDVPADEERAIARIEENLARREGAPRESD